MVQEGEDPWEVDYHDEVEAYALVMDPFPSLVGEMEGE